MEPNPPKCKGGRWLPRAIGNRPSLRPKSPLPSIDDRRCPQGKAIFNRLRSPGSAFRPDPSVQVEFFDRVEEVGELLQKLPHLGRIGRGRSLVRLEKGAGMRHGQDQGRILKTEAHVFSEATPHRQDATHRDSFTFPLGRTQLRLQYG